MTTQVPLIFPVFKIDIALNMKSVSNEVSFEIAIFFK